MKRINTPTASSGMFVDRNPFAGTKGTQFNAEWPNQVQEEICKLIEAAGRTVGESDHQLKDIFTVLHVLEAKFKSLELLKAFTGGNSTVEINGENLKMSASGDAVSDDSSLEISRMLLKFLKTTADGKSCVEIKPSGISFKIGSGLSEVATISCNVETGAITISSTAGNIIFSGKINASSGVKGNVETDFITPETERATVTIGSQEGGVGLVGRVISDSTIQSVNIPTDFVEISSNLDPDASRAILLNSLWSLGAVKRIFNKDSSDHNMWIYTDNQGSSLQITIPRNSYVNLACIGFYDNPYDNKTYVVTVYN